MPAKGVIAFDLDGTLIPDSTVCLHLSPRVGHHDMPELERLYAEGKITNQEVAERDAAYYEGRTRDELWEWLEEVDVITGIPETIATLRERELVPVIATITWKGAAEFFVDRFGFSACCGCELGEDGGVLTGRVARHIESSDKAAFVHAIAAAEGLDAASIVAIGDSTSDLPLFEEAGFAIALNATQNAKDAADVSIDTGDLRDVLPLIDEYFAKSRT